MKLTFDSPFTLTFTIAAVLIFFIAPIGSDWSGFFILSGVTHCENPVWYASFLGYTLGHASIEHLVGNLSIFLLLGPILEHRYGTKKMIIMSTITGVTTAIFHVLFWDEGLLGASGLVFMFIILSSLSHSRSGEIPLSFIFIVLLYLGNEIYASFENDQISQFAHIAGGIAGGIYGLYDR